MRDNAGQPVAGVGVNAGLRNCTSGCPGANATTDVAGAYTLTVSGGIWWVTTGKQGYMGVGREVSVADGQQLGGVDFTITLATSSIVGKLRYENGNPAAGVGVWGGRYNGNGWAQWTPADPQGVFTLSVTSGTWFPVAWQDGYTLQATPLVAIGDYQVVTSTDLVLLPNTAQFTGTVRNSAGNPVAGAQVVVGDWATGHGLSTGVIADASGAYTLPVGAGTWRVYAWKSGWTSGGDRTGSIAAGQTLGGFDFTLNQLNATIAGTVRDAVTGLPIAGARVNTGSPTWGTGTTTDASGAYTLTVFAGTWNLNANKEGYLQASRSVSVGDGQQVSGVDLNLTPGSSLITGTIRYNTGGTVPNQWVWAGDGTGKVSNPSADATGVYSLSVTAGTWTLHSRLNDYTLQQTPRVTIGDNQTIGGIDLVFVPNDATVTGRVRDQGGTGVAGVWLDGRDASTGAPVTQQYVTDASGSYTLPIAVGTWRIGLSQKEGSYRFPPDQTVTLASGQTRTGVDFTLTALNATISGSVRDGTGQPLAGANVNTGAPDWGTGTTTDAAGVYTLTVYGGTWNVNANKPGYVGQSRQVAVGDGQHLGGVDFTLAGLNATIAGTVRDAATGQPIAGARLDAWGPGSVPSVTADASGAYTLPVRSGTWWVKASKVGYVGIIRYPVSVGDGQRVGGVDFDLRLPTAWIGGTVRRGDGTPLPGNGVWINGMDGDGENSGSADATGVYTLGVVAGRWHLKAEPGDNTLLRTPVLTIQDGQVITGTDLWVLTNSVTVTGRVRDQAGNGVGSVHVEPRDADTGHWLSHGTDTDPGGYYTLTLPVGPWQVGVWRDGYRNPPNQSVTLGSGETRTGVNFTLTALNATISGIVRDASGSPVAGANVNTGAPDWGTGATTDATGAYTLTVWGGSWWVSVGKPGYAGAGRQVVVGDGQHVGGVDFTLTALNAIIAGTIRDAVTSLPIAGARVNTGTPTWGTGATTDASGAYTLTVFAGTWNLNANKAGYLQASRTATVSEGQQVNGADLNLTPGSSLITGTIRYSTGGTVANQWVWAGDGTGKVSNPNADATGVYSLSVTAGTWTLHSRLSGYTLRETPRATIGDNQTIGGIDLVFVPNDATVTGRVRDQSGAGVTGVRVDGRDATTRAPVTQDYPVDASGYYTLPIAAGTWRIGVGWSGAYRFPPEQAVTLASGETRTGVDFTLTALNATISGTVRDATGSPVAGANVNANTPGWGTGTTTDASGAYTLTVYGGAWNVNAGKQGFVGAGRQVVVGDGQQVAGVDFVLTALNATIAGTIRDAVTGELLAGAKVNAGISGWGTGTTTDALGAYTLTVAAGTWNVNASKPGYLQSSDRTVSVGDGQRVDGIDISLTPATAWIVGTVRQGDGTSLPGMNVWTWPYRWSGPGGSFGNADATGVYTLGVVAGSWYVIGGPAGLTLSRTPTVTVQDGQVATGIDLLLLTNSVTVTGQVRDQAGNGVGGAHVEPRDPDSGHSLSWGTDTGPGGYYTLTLPVGTWQLGVWRSGYRSPSSQTVTLADGETRTGVDFTLTALNATIAGTVRDGAGAPIAGANVNTGTAGWGTGTATDASGVYTLTVYGGSWWVNAGKSGYAGTSRQVTVGDGEHLGGVDFTLTALNATIAGTVRDAATGLPIAGASVNTGTATWGTNTTTDALGAYTLTVSAGPWWVNASRFGYLRSSSQTVSVGDGQRVDGVDFSLTPATAWIVGTVRQGDGTPWPGTGVWTNRWNGPGGTGSGGADATGVYTLGVTAGTWYVVADRSGYTLSRTPMVSIQDGQTITGTDLVLLTNNVTVTGRVRDQSGNGVGGAHVEPRDGTTGHWLSQGTNADASGNYTLTVAVGTWQVAVSRSGYRSPANQTVTLADGETLTGVDFTLTALNATISGIVRDATTGQPLAGARVETGVPGWGTSMNTDASGAYTLTVFAGTWNVSASKEGYFVTISGYLAVGDGEHVRGIDLSLRPLNATIVGTVRDAVTGSPVAGASVNARAPNGWKRSVTTDAAGTYTLTVSAWTWQVDVSKAGYLRSSSQTVSVGDGEQVDGIDFSLTPATAWIVGTVRQGDGTPWPGTGVWTNRWNGSGGSNGGADATGVYTLGVTAGTWYVVADRSGYTLSRTPMVSIQDGQTITGTDLVLLTNSVTVTGRVRDQSGNGVGGAHVEPRDGTTGHWLSQGTNADASGNYTLTLPVGTWQVAVSRSGYRSPSNQTVTLASGETRTGVDFTLAALNATIAGTVRDAATGQPVAGARVDTGTSGWGTKSTADASGAYTLTVFAGTWWVNASKVGYLRSADRTVSVGDGQRVDGIDFSLDPGTAWIVGTVRRGDGTALPGTGVWTNRWNGPGGSSGSADATGVYTLGVTAGSWVVVADQGSDTLSGTPLVSIQDGQVITGTDLVRLTNTVTVTGRVRDQAGNGVGNTHVVPRDTTTGYWLSGGTDTDASGVYTLTLPVGTWQVGVSRSGYRSPSNQTVTLGSGETRTGVDFTLTALNSTIAGTVRDGATGEPLAGVKVYANISGWSTSATTDAAGVYTATVYAGTWTMSNQMSGYTLRETPRVVIGDNQTITSVDLVYLPNDATVIGQVRDQAGFPVAGAKVKAADVNTGNAVTVDFTVDASGTYTLPIAAGTWRIGVRGVSGYRTPSDQTLAVATGEVRSGVDFTFMALNATIVGTVLDAVTGQPIVGASVSANSSGWGTSVSTNASGAYTVAVHAGTWTMTSPSRDGYTLRETPRVVIGDYQTTTDVDLVFVPNDATITGRVRDQNGLPVAGAKVRGADANTGNTVTPDVVVDASGAYTLPIAAGTWRIGVSKMSGYRTPSDQTLAVASGEARSGVDFTLTALNATIVGTMRNGATGQPIAGASVSANTSGWSTSTTTNASGVYTVAVHAGTWTMTSQAMGGYTLRETPRVVIGDYQTITGIDLVFLPNDATVTGRVQDQNGLPVAGAKVKAADVNTGSAVTLDYVVDASGSYTLPIAAGTWRIGVRDLSGYRTPFEQTLTLATGEVRSGVDFTMMTLNATIAGTVRDAVTGEPVAGARVDTGVSNWGTSTTSDASGAYTLTVSAGTWTVNANKAGYLQSSRTASVGDAQRVDGVDLSLTPATAWIVGTVRRGDGMPLAVKSVWADRQNGPRGSSTSPDATGVYTLGVTAGNWIVSTDYGDYTLSRTPLVSIQDGQVITGIDLILLTNSATVTGRVRDLAGNGVAGASVAPRDFAVGYTLARSATTDASGIYTLTLPAGTWQLRVSRSGYRIPSYPTVTLGSGELRSGVDFTLRPLNATIGGTLRDGLTGQALTGASVTASTSGWSTSVSVSASGAYTLAVHGGTWTLSSQIASYTLREAPRVAIDDNQTVTGIDLVFLPNDATVTGRVRDQAGLPVPGAKVRGRDARGSSMTTDVVVDASGYYTLPIAAGTWWISVPKISGYRGPSDQPLTVTSGEARSGVDFTLTALSATIAGTVRNGASGLPLGGTSVNANISGWNTSAPANASGAYTVAVHAGTWTMSSQTGGFTLRETPSVVISDNQTITGIDLVFLPNDATVTGRVRDQAGLPIAGARVKAAGLNSGYAVTLDFWADASGTYTLPIAAGTWRIGVRDLSGYRTPPEQTVTLASGQTLTGVDFTLEPAGSIAGTVWNADGTAPLAGIGISAIRTDAAPPAQSGSACTDAAGNYQISNLSFASYRVVARGDAGCGSNPRYVFEYYSERSASAYADPVVVSSTVPVPGVDFTLELGGAITGTVEARATGAPLAGIPVWARLAADPNVGAWACTDALGDYAILGAPYGTYTVTASPSGPCPGDPRYLRQYWNDRSSPAMADPVPVSADVDATAIDFALDLGGSIAGNLSYAGQVTGTHRIYLSVHGIPDSGPLYYTSTTGVGPYTLVGLPDGVYTLGAYLDADGDNNPWWGSPGGPPPPQPEPDDPRASYGQPITITNGSAITGIDLVLRDPVVPQEEFGSVRVSNRTDNAFTLSWVTSFASPARVVAVPPDGGTPITAVDTREDFTHYVRVSGLMPETPYTVSVYSGDVSIALVLTVTTGPTIGAIPPVDTLAGYLYEADGVTAAAGAIVYLRVEDADGQGSSGRSALLSALVGSDGTWLIDLPPRRLDLQDYFASGHGDRFRLVAEGAQRGGLVRHLPAGGPRLLGGLNLVPGVNVPLQAGWNLLALPHGQLGPYTAQSLLAELQAQGINAQHIARWEGGAWQSHLRGFPANDFPIEPGRGYFVRTTHAGIWHARPPTAP